MSPRIRGSGNRIATPSVITNEALFRLKTKLFFPRLAQRTFQSYFLDKNGEKIWIKRPTAAKISSGRVIPSDNSTRNPMIDRYIEMTLNQRHNFVTSWNDEEASLDIVALADRYIDPGAEELAYKYDIEGGNALGNGGQWCHPVPIDGTGNPGVDGSQASITPSALTVLDVQTIRAHAHNATFPTGPRTGAFCTRLTLLPSTTTS